VKKEVEILKVKGNTRAIQKDFVVKEFSVQITFNGRMISELSCTPRDLGYLGVGNLYSNGTLTSIEGLTVKIDKTRVDIIVKEKEKGIFRNKIGDYTISLDSIFKRFVSC